MLTPGQRQMIRYAAGHLVDSESEDAIPDPHASDSADLAWDIFEEMFALRRDIDRDSGGPLMMNERGEWVPAIPVPLRVGLMQRPQCIRSSEVNGPCQKKFWTEEEYEQHYALDHIVRGK